MTANTRITEEGEVLSVFEIEGVSYTRVGIVIPEQGFTYENWVDMVWTLNAIEDGICWAIGDALNYGGIRYGETYAQVEAATGKDRSTLYTYKAVAATFPMDVRRVGVHFSKHEACAKLYKLAPDVALEILDRAKEDCLNLREVRFDVRSAKAELGLHYDDEPDDDGDGDGDGDDGEVVRTHRTHMSIERPHSGRTPTPIRPMSVDEMLPNEAHVEWLDDLLRMVVELAEVERPATYKFLEIRDKARAWCEAHEVPLHILTSVL